MTSSSDPLPVETSLPKTSWSGSSCWKTCCSGCCLIGLVLLIGAGGYAYWVLKKPSAEPSPKVHEPEPEATTVDME